MAEYVTASHFHVFFELLQVIMASALKDVGVDELWGTIQDYTRKMHVSYKHYNTHTPFLSRKWFIRTIGEPHLEGGGDKRIRAILSD